MAHFSQRSEKVVSFKFCIIMIILYHKTTENQATNETTKLWINLKLILYQAHWLYHEGETSQQRLLLGVYNAKAIHGNCPFYKKSFMLLFKTFFR